MCRVVALTLLAVPFTRVQAQQSPGLLDQKSSAIVLRSDTRLIVEDVVVTDAAGKPVEGLPESAFHLTDDGRPQSIRSFEERKAVKQSSTMAATPGVLSNASMKDSSLNLNVLLIDPTSVELADQMFLRLQAFKYLESMPESTAMAIFRTSRDGRPLLVQSATTDRALLKKAIDNCVPTLAVSVPANEVFLHAIGELSNIAEYLGQMRGHKSLIWLAGQFPLAQVLGGNGAQQAAEFDEMQEATKSVYRKLEAAKSKHKASYVVSDAPLNAPIIFEAKVRPGVGRDNSVTIEYAIAASDLSFQINGDGQRQARLRVAALAYDMSGQVKSNAIDAVTTHYSEEQMAEAQRVGIPVLQKLDIGHGAKFLLLSVIDLDSGRTGTVQLAVASAR